MIYLFIPDWRLQDLFILFRVDTLKNDLLFYFGTELPIGSFIILFLFIFHSVSKYHGPCAFQAFSPQEEI